MESMRDLLKRNLGRSLEALPVFDRLVAAWPVACGTVMAARGEVIAFDGGVLRIHVQNTMWLEQMLSMRAMLECELARIANVNVAAIHFEVPRPGPHGELSCPQPDSRRESSE